MLPAKVSMMFIQKFHYKKQSVCFDFLTVTVAII